ncbi:MAG: helix-turn-helix transcriptional regulator, partial [Nitrososphaerales archaeon]
AYASTHQERALHRIRNQPETAITGAGEKAPPFLFGRGIRVLRTDSGKRQAILAHLAGLPREHLSELENGHQEIGIKALENITKALGVSLRDFFDGI